MRDNPSNAPKCNHGEIIIMISEAKCKIVKNFQAVASLIFKNEDYINRMSELGLTLLFYGTGLIALELSAKGQGPLRCIERSGSLRNREDSDNLCNGHPRLNLLPTIKPSF